MPEKHPDLSQGAYEKYLGLLGEAYDKEDGFQAVMQLANLKADAGITFDLLETTVKEHTGNCEKIYDFYFLYDRHNFGMNLVKLDTIRFKKVVELCDALNDGYSYSQYAKRRDKEEQEAKKKKDSIKEDSSGFDLELVKKLEKIHFDDQEIRKRLNAKNLTEEQKETLFDERRIIDSVNLVKIDAIFKDYGYPSRALVGKKCNFTPALVIHHSETLETRYKYLPFLEDAVAKGLLYEGTLDMIKSRIEGMELDQE